MNRYTIISQLGDGSFGVVSKATNANGEVVAVKKMKQKFSSWEECLQLREIQSLRRLQHPNIIKLKEVVREHTELFMIFELGDMNIYQITRMRSEQHGSVPGIFNDREIRSIMAQTLLGLAAMHKGGFMHRDLKPENLLCKGDVIKIADFGLAKEIRSRPPFTEYVSTRWYRAPEIILRSVHYNSPIDIWACGVIFAELYLNRPLFPGASDTDQLFKICSVLGSPSPNEWDEGYQLARRLNIRFPQISPTSLRQLLPNVPSAALELIEQMLRFNPSDRPTASACLRHHFFTGQGADPMTLFQGVSSGQPHNPFLIAAAGTGGTAPCGSNNMPSAGAGHSSSGYNRAGSTGSPIPYGAPVSNPVPGPRVAPGHSGATSPTQLFGTGVGNVGVGGGAPAPGFSTHNTSGSGYGTAFTTNPQAHRPYMSGYTANNRRDSRGTNNKDDDFLY